MNITNGNFTNSGSFTHNSGRVILGGGTGENQSITGASETTFFNLNITNGVVAVTQEQNATIEGVLKNVTDNEIELEWKTREPKPLGKGKVTVIKDSTIPFSNILEAKVKIIF